MGVFVIINSSTEETQYCSRCGKALDFWDLNEDFTIHKTHLGFGTKYDGDELHLRLCCECIEKLIDACAVYPITERED